MKSGRVTRTPACTTVVILNPASFAVVHTDFGHLVMPLVLVVPAMSRYLENPVLECSSFISTTTRPNSPSATAGFSRKAKLVGSRSVFVIGWEVRT